MFERDGRVGDRFPPPSTWKNEQQARILYNGTVPPDMSVLAKARSYERGFPWFLIDALPFFQYQEHGVDYVVALLKGYKDTAAGLPASGRRQLQRILPRPLDRDAAAFDRRPRRIHRRQPGDDRSVRQGRRRLHDVDGRAAPGSAQAHRLPGDDLPLVLAGLIYFTKKKIWAEVH